MSGWSITRWSVTAGGGDPGRLGRDNVVANNLIVDNREGIRSFELSGLGNGVTGNILWDNAWRWPGDVGGLALAGNLTREPRLGGAPRYRPRKGSAAVDRGQRRYGTLVDYLGRRRVGAPTSARSSPAEALSAS